MANVWFPRGELKNTRKALASGSLKLGFLGGSITDQEGGERWPQYVENWLLMQYPGLRLQVENLARGATGSDVAMLRSEREVLACPCDLMFVEYAVNDQEVPTDIRMRSREGLLRRLLKTGETDVIIVYTFSQYLYPAMEKDEMPDTIAEFELLAEHYNVPSVWMGMYALEMVRKGQLHWEEWLPDTLHPNFAGSRHYGDSVNMLLAQELAQPEQNRPQKGGALLPAPYHPKNWEDMEMVSFADMTWEGPWRLYRSQYFKAVDQFLSTSALGASVTIPFTGTGLILGLMFGPKSSEFLYSIDGGEPVRSNRTRPAWCVRQDWYRTFTPALDLPYGPHTCKITVIHGGDGCTGTHFDLGAAGVLK